MIQPKQVTCIIIDDDDLAVRLLEDYVAKTPGLVHLGSFGNAVEALRYLHKSPADLLLLDIQMPEMNGLQLLEKLEQKPEVVITTSSPHFAIDGFRLNVSDYLLKPFLYERFEEAINRVKEYLFFKDGVSNNKTLSDHFFVKSGYRMIRINLEDVYYVEGWKQYVKIHLKDRFIITLDSMKNMEQLLPVTLFTRIHKSFIVCRQKMENFSQQKVTICGRVLPVGKTYWQSFKDLIR